MSENRCVILPQWVYGLHAGTKALEPNHNHMNQVSQRLSSYLASWTKHLPSLPSFSRHLWCFTIAHHMLQCNKFLSSVTWLDTTTYARQCPNSLLILYGHGEDLIT